MSPPSNHFLRSLSRGDFELIRLHLRDMKFIHGSTLYDVGHPIERLYFPESGVISLVVVLQSGDMIEAGMIGIDGVVGTSAALDGAIALNQAIVQIAGAGSAIDVGLMREAVATSRSLRVKLYQHDQLLLAQAQQSAACNAKHAIEERLCRWLLRTHDLVQSDRIELTQEFLSQMLGVRRTSVTLAARHLQAVKIIKYRRGCIDILDIDALQEASCECYDDVKIQVARLLGEHSPAAVSSPRLTPLPGEKAVARDN
jgi:CRP-like cAMP-binding protein